MVKIKFKKKLIGVGPASVGILVEKSLLKIIGVNNEDIEQGDVWLSVNISKLKTDVEKEKRGKKLIDYIRNTPEDKEWICQYKKVKDNNADLNSGGLDLQLGSVNSSSQPMVYEADDKVVEPDLEDKEKMLELIRDDLIKAKERILIKFPELEELGNKLNQEFKEELLKVFGE